MERKRTKIDIIGDMLASIVEKGGAIKPTHLMYKSNLAHGQMKSYLEELINKDFVHKVLKNKYEYLAITDKGVSFINQLRQMKEFERAFGL